MIAGKIVRIISNAEVILNVGAEAGVKKGMEFVIYAESDRMIDPETGEDLGVIETIKGRLTVTHVMDKMSRAKTESYEVIVPSGTFDAMASAVIGFGVGPRRETRYAKLKVEESQVLPLREDMTVHIGDLVKSI